MAVYINGVSSSGQPTEFKTAVRVATQGNLSATRSGNSLTSTGNVVLTQTILDPNWSGGAALAVGDRVLVAAQTTQPDNGIYVVANLGSLLTPWVLTRASDMDTSSDTLAGCITPVSEGTDANLYYQLSIVGSVTINVTSLTFIKTGNSQTTPVSNLNIYVSSAGSDTNSGLYAGTPLLTLGAAIRLAAKLRWSESCVINFAAGTYAMFPDGTDTLTVPVGGGLNCGPVCVRGTTTDSGLGTLTATGGSAGASLTWQTVTTSAVAGGDDLYQGYFVVFDAATTTVALRGHVALIARETTSAGTTTWKLATQLSTSPVAGDTFTVVKPATVFSLSSLTGVVSGGAILFQWVQFTASSSLSRASATNGTAIHASACWFGDGGANVAGLSSRFGGSVHAGDANLTTPLPSLYAVGLKTDPPGCLFARGSMVCLDATSYAATYRSLYKAADSFTQLGPSVMSVVYFTGATRLSYSGGPATLSLSEFDTATTTGYYVQALAGSLVTASTVRFTNSNATSAALECTGTGTFQSVSGITGSMTTGVPISLDAGGTVNTFGSGNTLTGVSAGVEVRVDNGSLTWTEANTLGRISTADKGGLVQWSGGFTATGGADTFYFSTSGLGATNGTNNSASALALPISSARRMTRLRLKPVANTLSAGETATFYVLKNGSVTTLAVTVTGATGTAAVSKTNVQVPFADGDTIDLRATITATVGHALQFVATLQII